MLRSAIVYTCIVIIIIVTFGRSPTPLGTCDHSYLSPKGWTTPPFFFFHYNIHSWRAEKTSSYMLVARKHGAVGLADAL
ncbi:hypothetical protein F5Y08DRAFT_293703 [Xylaria arbuscula]|nr:hypothetical protein F5Y08DRAFT_293703 [Xylaria arbuscula]